MQSFSRALPKLKRVNTSVFVNASTSRQSYSQLLSIHSGFKISSNSEHRFSFAYSRHTSRHNRLSHHAKIKSVTIYVSVMVFCANVIVQPHPKVSPRPAMSYFEVRKRLLTLFPVFTKYKRNHIRNHLNMVSGGVFIRHGKNLPCKEFSAPRLDPMLFLMNITHLDYQTPPRLSTVPIASVAHNLRSTPNSVCFSQHELCQTWRAGRIIVGSERNPTPKRLPSI